MGLISSRYPGRCRNCKTAHRAGDRVHWTKGIKGVLCVNCAGNQTPQTPAVTPRKAKPEIRSERDSNGHRWMISWRELKEIARRVMDNDMSDFPRNPAAKEQAHRAIHLQRGTSWHGYTVGQLSRWLSDGYESETIQSLQDFTPPLREKRRYIFDEEGDEIHLDLAWSGADNFHSQWTKRETIPGVSIEVATCFSFGASAQPINDYNRWVCKVVYSLETSGVDCEINTVCQDRNLFNDGEIRTTVVRLKSENEATDFLSFSAMLGPPAFRSFMFLAHSVWAEEEMGKIDQGQGSVSGHDEWGVEYDSEHRVIRLTAPYHPSKFPEEDMTRQLREVLKSMKENN